jgi:hypothetical protein
MVDVERSYTVLALLRVCEVAARYIEQEGDKALAGCLANVIEHANTLVGETHDVIERSHIAYESAFALVVGDKVGGAS